MAFHFYMEIMLHSLQILILFSNMFLSLLLPMICRKVFLQRWKNCSETF